MTNEVLVIIISAFTEGCGLQSLKFWLYVSTGFDISYQNTMCSFTQSAILGLGLTVLSYSLSHLRLLLCHQHHIVILCCPRYGALLLFSFLSLFLYILSTNKSAITFIPNYLLSLINCSYITTRSI